MHQNIDAYVLMHKFSFLNYYAAFLAKPIPSLTLLEFSLNAQANNHYKTIRSHMPIESNKYNKNYFSTTRSCIVNPLCISHVSCLNKGEHRYQLSITFETLGSSCGMDCELKDLLVYINTKSDLAFCLLHCLTAHLKQVFVCVEEYLEDVSGDVLVKYAVNAWQEPLLPGAHALCRSLSLVHDFGLLPEKYAFFYVQGLEQIATLKKAQAFSLQLHICSSRELDQGDWDPQIFKLNCVPAVALRCIPIEPIKIDAQRGEYTLHLAESHDGYSIYALNTLVGRDRKSCLYSFQSLAARGTADGLMEWRETLSEASPKLYISMQNDFTPCILSGSVWGYLNSYTHVSENNLIDLVFCDDSCHAAMSVHCVMSPTPFISKSEIDSLSCLDVLTLDYRQIFNNVSLLKQFFTSCISCDVVRKYINGLLDISVSKNSALYHGVLVPIHHLNLVCDPAFYVSQWVMIQWAVILYYYYLSCLPILTLAKLSVGTPDNPIIHEWFDEL